MGATWIEWAEEYEKEKGCELRRAKAESRVSLNTKTSSTGEPRSLPPSLKRRGGQPQTGGIGSSEVIEGILISDFYYIS